MPKKTDRGNVRAEMRRLNKVAESLRNKRAKDAPMSDEEKQADFDYMMLSIRTILPIQEKRFFMLILSNLDYLSTALKQTDKMGVFQDQNGMWCFPAWATDDVVKRSLFANVMLHGTEDEQATLRAQMKDAEEANDEGDDE